jgi:hypothetical protein
MTCPKCRSHHAQPFESWTIVGHKMTIPLLRLWACVNPDCRHQWPREFANPIVAFASPASPDLPTQEVAYNPCSRGLSPSIPNCDGVDQPHH